MEQAVDLGDVVDVDMVVLAFLVEVDSDELVGMEQFPNAR